MAHPSQLLSEERPDPSPRAAGDRGPDETVDWASVEDDLDIVRHTRVNLLLTGPEWLVMKVTHRVIADVPARTVIPCEVGRLPLSCLSQPSGTLVFRDVDALDADGQAFLFDWLQRASAERQIVSTATVPLLARVNTGAFDPRLYYRLNTVYIRLGP